MGDDRTTIRLLVTDLDNTLYDWFDIWYRSFSPMLAKLVETSGVRQEVLEREIRSIHQQRGTSEYSHLIQEIPSLQTDGATSRAIGRKYWAAVEAFRRGRKEAMQLYPGVRQTLDRVKAAGTTIVAYTESLAFYTSLRIRWLGLDGVVDYLYSPEDHDLPAGVTPADLRTYEDDRYELKQTEHRHTPRGVLKPEPIVLQSIVDEFAVPAHSIAYVGDSMMKDVAMAQKVGVVDVHAAYGSVQQRLEYELLRRVSHWTDADVERERASLHTPPADPSYVLQTSFTELLALFEFRRT